MRSIVELGAIGAATAARVELRRLSMGPVGWNAPA